MRSLPIFLDFLNREANKAVGAERSELQDISILRTFLLCHNVPMSVNISQLAEYCADRPNLLAATGKMVGAKKIEATSQALSLDVFIGSRQKLYSHVAPRYPFFFEEAKKLEVYSIGGRNNFDMSKELSQKLLGLPLDGFAFDLLRASNQDMEVLKGRYEDFRTKILRRDGKAVTADLFKTDLESGFFSQGEIDSFARVISASYMQIYAERHRLAVPTGIPGFQFTEDARFFPIFDYPILDYAIKFLSYDADGRFDLDEIIDCHGGMRHAQFAVFLEAFIVSAFASISASENMPGSVESRRARLKGKIVATFSGGGRQAFRGLEEFYEAAWARLIVEGEKIGRSDPVFQNEWSKYMSNPAGPRVLIATATDIEDSELRAALNRAAYVERRAIMCGQGLVAEYVKGLNQAVYHVRTSAGALGANAAGVFLPIAIKELRITHILSVGICFGLDQKKNNLTDVIVSEVCQDYETVRQEDLEVRERGERVPCGTALLQAARLVLGRQQSKEFKTSFGMLIAGQKLVDSQDFVDQLRRRFPTAIAGDMEATAVSASAIHAGCQWITIKGICDWGVNKDKEAQQPAAKNASTFAVDVIETLVNAGVA